jgi:myo-inositol-1(or 4)-monophosphatase
MESHIIRRAKDVAVNAALKAGQIVKEHFDKTVGIQEKGSFGDVVTEVDFRAEEMILREITRAFPDHRITSEESGLSDKADAGSQAGASGERHGRVDPGASGAE